MDAIKQKINRGISTPRECDYFEGSASEPAPMGASGLAGGLGFSSLLGVTAGGLTSCFIGLPTALPPSTLASRATVMAKLVAPSITTSVDTIFTFELTNGVVFDNPAPSSTCRRDEGSLGIAVRPIATPSACRTSRRYSALCLTENRSFNTAKTSSADSAVKRNGCESRSCSRYVSQSVTKS